MEHLQITLHPESTIFSEAANTRNMRTNAAVDDAIRANPRQESGRQERSLILKLLVLQENVGLSLARPPPFSSLSEVCCVGVDVGSRNGVGRAGIGRKREAAANGE